MLCYKSINFVEKMLWLLLCYVFVFFFYCIDTLLNWCGTIMVWDVRILDRSSRTCINSTKYHQRLFWGVTFRKLIQIQYPQNFLNFNVEACIWFHAVSVYLLLLSQLCIKHWCHFAFIALSSSLPCVLYAQHLFRYSLYFSCVILRASQQ